MVSTISNSLPTKAQEESSRTDRKEYRYETKDCVKNQIKSIAAYFTVIGICSLANFSIYKAVQHFENDDYYNATLYTFLSGISACLTIAAPFIGAFISN
jgi:hypothetical protein